jgi:phosphatidylglycerol:prolipoprotein diacylglycerol transferase
MLFLSLVACVLLACRLARRQGIPREVIQDMAVWLVVGGVVGARTTFIIQYGVPLSDFYKVWDGGMVSFGSFAGGVVGFLLAYRFLLRKHGLRFWQVGDLLMPCLALGFAVGRFGCLLNGCCYGGVACPDCPAIHFNLPAAPRYTMTAKGYQTAAGFTLDERDPDGRTVGKVEPGSAADLAGLRPRDVILKAEGTDVHTYQDLENVLVRHWKRSKNDLALTVRRPGGAVEELPPFEPETIGLHPTQEYESVSMVLLLLVLLAYLPLRRHEGELVAVFAVGYAAQRFLDEMLRDDTPVILSGLRLNWGQIGSVLLAAAGVGLWLWLRLRPARREPAAVAAPRPQPGAAAAAF